MALKPLAILLLAVLAKGTHVEIVPADGATVSKEQSRAALTKAERAFKASLEFLEIKSPDVLETEDRIRVAVGKTGVFDGGAVVREVLGRTVGAAAPLWLTEGVAARFGDSVEACREDLAKNEFSLEWESLLTEIDPEAFAANRGPVLAWALVSLLNEANPKLVSALHDRCRRLATQLAEGQDAKTVRKEFTSLVNGWLATGGATEEKLRVALTTWVGAGFPTGGEFRRVEKAIALRGIGLPGTHSVTLAGTFTNARTIGPDTGRLLEHPKVTWRLPFKSRMKLWVGLRGARAGSLSGNAVARNRGLLSSNQYSLEWDAEPAGSRKPLDIGRLVASKRGYDKYGIMLLEVVSPGGVRFLVFREWPVK